MEHLIDNYKYWPISGQKFFIDNTQYQITKVQFGEDGEIKKFGIFPVEHFEFTDGVKNYKMKAKEFMDKFSEKAKKVN